MHISEKVSCTTNQVAQKVAQVTATRAYRRTQYFILIVSVLFVLIDIILPLQKLPAVSDLLRDWAFGKGFVMAWIWGVLAGHLFITRNEDARILDEILAIRILVISSLVLVCIACFWDIAGHAWLNMVLLAAGCAAGHYLWPQKPGAYGASVL